MSRLGSMSEAALEAVHSPNADASLIALLTISGANLEAPIYIADGFTQRLSETDEEVTYGVISRGKSFLFLPFTLSLPTEDDSAPRASISISNVTRYLTPLIRNLTGEPSVTIELVLNTSPSDVEVSFPGFVLGGITYNSETVTGTLTIDGLAVEPFPAHSFTPAYFPGLF